MSTTTSITWQQVGEEGGEYEATNEQGEYLLTVIRSGSSWLIADDGGRIRVGGKARWPTLGEAKTAAVRFLG